MTVAALTTLRSCSPLSSSISISISGSQSVRSPLFICPPSLASSRFSPLSLHLPLPLVPRADAGAGAGGGGDKGGSSGNGAGAGDDEFEEQEDEQGGMLMSQKFTLAYAALVGVGGVMGFLKKGSIKSAAAGGFSSLLLFYVYTQLPTNPTFASSLGLGISGALLAVMGSRFKKSGKIFPAGVVSLVSLFMTGGYLHAILRH